MAKSVRQKCYEKKHVTVTWGDAWSTPGWGVPEKPLSPSRIYTTGWLVAQSREGILIAGSLGTDNRNGDHFFIPRGMIYKIEVSRKHTVIRHRKCCCA